MERIKSIAAVPGQVHERMMTFMNSAAGKEQSVVQQQGKSVVHAASGRVPEVDPEAVDRRPEFQDRVRLPSSNRRSSWPVRQLLAHVLD